MPPNHPLAEVFGFPYDVHSDAAKRHRRQRLCPFNNKVPSCTKDRANAPLGVCSIFDNQGRSIAITCPIRFRQNWQIVEDAAGFLFDPGTLWTTLPEIRLNDRNGKSAGNIDMVLVSYDSDGQVSDFGALEIQGVYISGNMRRPFEKYMEDPEENTNLDWSGEQHYPRADYLSSSRKRLVPQLIYKGNILRSWQKKICVAIHEEFFRTLPQLPEVDRDSAQIAWMIYDLHRDKVLDGYDLRTSRIVYTQFGPALDSITTSNAGPVEDFVSLLQSKLDRQQEPIPPNAPTLLEEAEE